MPQPPLPPLPAPSSSSYGYDRHARPLSYPPPPPPQPAMEGSSQPWATNYGPQGYRDTYQSRGPYSDLRQGQHHSDTRRQVDQDHHSSRDNFHPPQGDFTFRVERPAGVEQYSSYRPVERDRRGPRKTDYSNERSARHSSYRNDRERHSGRDSRSRRDDGRKRREHPPRQHRPPHHGGSGRREREKAADRLLLSKKYDDQVELMLGDTTGRATYRDIDELSDSDETDMDISDNSDEDTAEPATKRARTSETAGPAGKGTTPDQEVPRWSNPDPYTALPPPDEGTRKKRDMVQMIRKARVEAERKKAAAQTEGLDFISFDVSDVEGDETGASPGKAKGQNIPDQVTPKTPAPIWPQEAPVTLPPLPLPPSLFPSSSSVVAPSTTAPALQPTNIARPARQESQADLTPSTSLGSRKRTIDDSIKLPHTSLKPVTKMRSDGGVVPEWQNRGPDSCPWASQDHSSIPSMSTRLHMEVVDFYEYVRPRDFEERIRAQMVDHLRKVIKMKWPDADVLPFGSFMSGLYLPTADMDISVCSNSFIDHGNPVYDRKKDLWALRSHLLYHRVPYQGQVEMILHAKVPLVKYKDAKTALKVDMSFEKLDGYRAINTFLQWKEKYPAMPTLVSIIKQFLLMRGLNEPVNGGIGGFSVICLVVNLLNQMPQVQSGAMKPEHHLGDILMEFFDYYGNHFHYKTVAIRMNPPGLVSKSQVSDVVYRNMDRLSILDPNNPQNDIAGGSSNTATILRHFSKAFDALRERMAKLAKGTGARKFSDTILGPILAGDYSSFRDQREYLRNLATYETSGYQPPEWQSASAW
ncbi:hypothetical protein GGS23DRAFT_603457 [Durotheca rogersii]|uniref:uncharacterized protein n=1 Tax=Durotheca rogersii TaxID=419775 RepID=UPI00221F490E|nr:uncharacterized protein GGS23DRAFT_603457 [Durotheca rogersii]KAI5866043.1 hypothetical protein GGS23DRAFT_603457 [Durotheca rogersii]